MPLPPPGDPVRGLVLSISLILLFSGCAVATPTPQAGPAVHPYTIGFEVLELPEPAADSTVATDLQAPCSEFYFNGSLVSSGTFQVVRYGTYPISLPSCWTSSEWGSWDGEPGYAFVFEDAGARSTNVTVAGNGSLYALYEGGGGGPPMLPISAYPYLPVELLVACSAVALAFFLVLVRLRRRGGPSYLEGGPCDPG